MHKLIWAFTVRKIDTAHAVAHPTCSNEPPHDKTNKIACAPSEDSDQPRHPPSLIRVFAVRMKEAWFLIYPLSAQRRLWSDWADAQADLSLRWAHSHFVGFVTRRLKLWLLYRIFPNKWTCPITVEFSCFFCCFFFCFFFLFFFFLVFKR